jgi:hypothetical protein
MAMWSPFSPPRPNSEQAQGEPAANARAAPEGDGKPSTSAGIDEIAELKAELGRMQAKIERLSQNRESRG